MTLIHFRSIVFSFFESIFQPKFTRPYPGDTLAPMIHSQRFDDFYFSPKDGLAETRHVFIAGNNLPARWRGRDDFVIAETGFGTGLNFLETWRLWQAGGAPGRLTYLSFEKYPLKPDAIAAALAAWEAEFGKHLPRLLDIYPALIPGFHAIDVTETLRLILVFDDVNTAMAQVSASVDCWYLDGFKPSTNPDMWSETVFDEMARLSAPGTTFATFTAAGFVRRGLEAAGFQVEKKPGFGTKREMITGVKI